MSNIEFDESKFKLKSRRVLGEPEVPVLIKFLVVKGIVKNETQAIIVSLLFIAVVIGISVYIGRLSSVAPATIDPQFVSYSLGNKLGMSFYN